MSNSQWLYDSQLYMYTCMPTMTTHTIYLLTGCHHMLSFAQQLSCRKIFVNNLQINTNCHSLRLCAARIKDVQTTLCSNQTENQMQLDLHTEKKHTSFIAIIPGQSWWASFEEIIIHSLTVAITLPSVRWHSRLVGRQARHYVACKHLHPLIWIDLNLDLTSPTHLNMQPWSSFLETRPHCLKVLYCTIAGLLLLLLLSITSDDDCRSGNQWVERWLMSPCLLYTSPSPRD